MAGVALACSLAGCSGSGSGAAAEAPAVTVGVAMPQGDSRWASDADNMVKQLTALGYKTEVTNADKAPATQVTQIQAMIDHGDKALIVGSVDGGALKDVLAKAAAKKIPVIAYDRLITGTSDVDYYATFDNAKVGVLQGQALLDGLNVAKATRPLNIEVFAGDPKDNNAGFFFDGAMSVLKPYIASGKIKVVSGETEFAKVATPNWDGKTAQARMEKLLAGPDAGVTLDGVLAPNDGLARGILAALGEKGYGAAGKPWPAITGQDSELESVKLVASGEQTETIFKDTRELAKVAVQMTNAVLDGDTARVNDTKQYNNGVKVVPTFLLQPVSVTKANYQGVLVDSGYYKSSDLS
ncbi:substrate-binding domain-containing protein [Motilibacter peucedani]|uniref:substrate-binding domain-containing protein n=1 Tax=Motilibacter peucedani TaxID=598650 RepID=UPI001E306845|nr:sugar-binding protein [Motilibacter peucedani]